MNNKPIGSQQNAVTNPARHLLVIAPPGCGKTEVLAMRAEHLLQSGVIRPKRRLLALTFTNRAKDNLGSRLRQQLGEARVRSSVSIMNFHELGARIVEAHFKSIGLKPGFAFPNASWSRKAIAGHTSDWKAQKAAKELLDGLKRETLTDLELVERLKRSGDRVALAVELQRQSENYVDYGDVLRYAALLLQNKRISSLFQEHYDAVLVDEFQDLSLQQFGIANAVCSTNTTYVGDPYQGIFGWAGAQPKEVHADLLTNCGDAVDLDVSFRSSPAVLDVINAVSGTLGAAQLAASNPSDWSKGGHAYAFSFASDAKEAAGIVSLTDRLARQFPNDRIGVICRAEFRRGALEQAYASATAAPQYWDIALDTPRAVRLLKQHVRHVDDSQEFSDQVTELLERVRSAIRPTDIDTLRDMESACEQLLGMGEGRDSLRQVMGRIRDTQDPTPIQSGVHVLNAHVGKGQQFDWVVVMGLEEGHVPSTYASSSSEVEEELRVLLVMLSRARKGLFLTHAKETRNRYGRVFREGPSRWWPQMEAACKVVPESIGKIVQG